MQKEIRFQGSASVVSLILHICNKSLGFPTVVRHGIGANIYAEYQLETGLCTLFTRSTKDLYTITVHFKPDVENECGEIDRYLKHINSTILGLIELPDFLSVFFLSPEIDNAQSKLEDPKRLGDDAQRGNSTSQ